MEDMVEKELVSVIITSYHLGEYLWDTIHSVEKQTYRNLEVIIADDGSEDEVTRATLENIEKNTEYRVIRIKNSGVSVVRNIGVEASHGEYIMFLDGDDIIAPSYIEKCVKVMSLNKKAGLVYSISRLFGDAHRIRPLDSPKYKGLLIYNHYFYVTCLMRKELFLKAGKFNGNMKKGLEDWELFIRYCHEGMEVYRINEILFFYRIRKNSRTKSVNGSLKNTFDVRMEILRSNREIYISYPACLKKFRLTIDEKKFVAHEHKKVFLFV